MRGHVRVTGAEARGTKGAPRARTSRQKATMSSHRALASPSSVCRRFHEHTLPAPQGRHTPALGRHELGGVAGGTVLGPRRVEQGAGGAGPLARALRWRCGEGAAGLVGWAGPGPVRTAVGAAGGGVTVLLEAVQLGAAARRAPGGRRGVPERAPGTRPGGEVGAGGAGRRVTHAVTAQVDDVAAWCAAASLAVCRAGGTRGAQRGASLGRLLLQEAQPLA